MEAPATRSPSPLGCADLLDAILAHLDPLELVRVRRVCKAWRSAVPLVVRSRMYMPTARRILARLPNAARIVPNVFLAEEPRNVYKLAIVDLARRHAERLHDYLTGRGQGWTEVDPASVRTDATSMLIERGATSSAAQPPTHVILPRDHIMVALHCAAFAVSGLVGGHRCTCDAGLEIAGRACPEKACLELCCSIITTHYVRALLGAIIDSTDYGFVCPVGAEAALLYTSVTPHISSGDLQRLAKKGAAPALFLDMLQGKPIQIGRRTVSTLPVDEPEEEHAGALVVPPAQSRRRAPGTRLAQTARQALYGGDEGGRPVRTYGAAAAAVLRRVRWWLAAARSMALCGH